MTLPVLPTLRLAALSLLATPLAAIAQSEAAKGAAHADHAHAAPAGVLPTVEQGIVPMIVAILVFAVVCAVLSVKVWPAISKGLGDREAKIRGEIEAAEKARAQAKAALAEYEKSLGDARAEAQKMLETAKVQQQALAAELKAKSEVELNAMREKAMKDIDSAKKAALGEIYTQAATLATTVAGKILQRDINPADQQRLVDDALAGMKASRN